MAYCQEIHLVPPEDSWIVPLDIILREIPSSYRFLYEVPNEHSVYQKVNFLKFPYRRWSIVQRVVSFLEICRASWNPEALYRKDMYDFFNLSDPTALEMINQAANGGHSGAQYVFVIMSIFNGGSVGKIATDLTYVTTAYKTLKYFIKLAQS
ncbi:putative F-box protein At1g67623 [Solanum lycopersicum]|uniref:putative F-box protein At1g67623 n=1 Tax=Solanum lycopersicum TaxID=4081 RepID=UPI003747E302